MDLSRLGAARYSIWDPTGNITLLVEGDIAVDKQPAVASMLMERHPEVEQVGFVRPVALQEEAGTDGALRMAGGEFCGNASLCAAALICLRSETAADGAEPGWRSLRIRVSGVGLPVELRLRALGSRTWEGSVRMPPAKSVGRRLLSHSGLRAKLPLVELEGITHAVITEGSPFAALLHEAGRAEDAVRSWCAELGAEALGLMFVSGKRAARSLTPLVYVPASGTVFWESSCASGSAATGLWLATDRRSRLELDLREPGGTLHVSSDAGGSTLLTGRVRLTSTYDLR